VRVKEIAGRYFARPLRWSRRIVDTLTRRQQSDELVRQFERQLERSVKDLSSKIESSTLELLAINAMVINQQHEQMRILERLENSNRTRTAGTSESEK
jgi:hypothetical protein